MTTTAITKYKKNILYIVIGKECRKKNDGSLYGYVGLI